METQFMDNTTTAANFQVNSSVFKDLFEKVYIMFLKFIVAEPHYCMLAHLMALGFREYSEKICGKNLFFCGSSSVSSK
jgi:hypothetical protein